MDRSLSWISGFVLGSLLATPLAAAELTVEPRLTAGISFYNLDLDDELVVDNDVVDDVEYSDLLYVFGGGLTFVVNRFFVDVYGQYSFDGDENLDLDVVAGGAAINGLAQDVDFERVETALTVGYRVTDQFATFIGFRYADVDFDGSGLINNVNADFSTEFSQKGPFIGASYVVPKPIFRGSVVVNAAVAYLDGDLEAELSSDALADEVNFDVDGDAVGVNAGINWVAPLTNRLKLAIGADVSQYSFKDDDNETDFDELITRLRTEIRYSF